jgi:hypothetical protein
VARRLLQGLAMTSLKLCLALGLVASIGCGKVEPTPDEPAGGEPAPGSAASMPPQDPAPSTVPRRRGNIDMTSGQGVFRASADFPIAEPPLDATSAEPCRVWSGSATGPTPSDSAGDIVVELPSAGGATTSTSTLTYDAKQRAYAAATLEAPRGKDRIEAPGAPIKLHAAGAAVPAFDVDVPSAYDADIVEPPAGTVIGADPGPLTVRWTDGGNEVVFVSISMADALLSCRFAASAREGVIPATKLKELVTKSNVKDCTGACVTLGLTSMRTSRVSAGGFDVFASHSVTTGRELKAE